MQHTRTDSAYTAPHYQQIHGRAYPLPQPLHTHHERDEEAEPLSLSPEQKRRRFNNERQRGYPPLSPVPYSAPQPFSHAPMSAGGYRSQQLPSPSVHIRPGTMGPPPQHSPLSRQSRQQYPARLNTFDESLRLPPLQTQTMNPSAPSTQRPELQVDNRESQARSIEAMVMTIPYINKIKVLSKISPPLASPGPTSPAHEVRGAVIAIEGQDRSLVTEVGALILDHLSAEPSFAVKSWSASASSPKKQITPTPDTEMTGADTSIPSPPASADSGDQEPFIQYLSTISEWHKKSQDIIKYITTAPSLPTTETTAAPSGTRSPRLLPIAVLSQGFSLAISDAFALRIPINDSYAPVDHWQWMATLWRGIVGPDLTVLVKRVRDRDELDRVGGVEIRADCAAVVVRVPETGSMDEKTARRLGFEVLEFIRSTDGWLRRN